MDAKTTTPAPPALPKVGSKFTLSKLERLDTAKAFATLELERAKIEDAHQQYLDNMGRRVLKRCGHDLSSGKLFLRYNVVDGALQEIEVIPEPTPTDEAPEAPAQGPDTASAPPALSADASVAAPSSSSPAPSQS